MRSIRRVSVLLVFALLAVVSTASVALAQEAEEPGDVRFDSPIRGIEIDTTRGRVDLDVNLQNLAETRRVVHLELEGVPDRWNIGVWSRFFDFRINEYVVEPTAADPDRVQQVRIRIMPPSNVEGGEHSFTLRATSPDGAVVYDEAAYTVRVREPEEADGGSVTLRSDPPVLRGSPGTTLGFEVVLVHDIEEEDNRRQSFRLAADPPSGWNVDFREPFGQQRVIGAVSADAGISERVRVDLGVPRDAELGEYQIPVTVSNDRGQAEVILEAELTGRGELRAGTTTGRLNMEARAGRAGTSELTLRNVGTAELTDIQLQSDAPANWVVDFGITNDTVASLPAGNDITVPVSVTPPDDAIPGDYAISVAAVHADANANLDYRVTVTQSTIWGWLGIVLVVLVVGGMIGLFVKLGRR